jgi:outer membrane protein
MRTCRKIKHWKKGLFENRKILSSKMDLENIALSTEELEASLRLNSKNKDIKMKKIGMAFGLLFIGTIVFAQDTTSFSLEQAKEYALKHNYSILNTQKDIEIAKKIVWQSTASMLPQITSEAKMQNFIDLPTSLVPAQSFNPNAPADQLVGLQFGTDYNNSVGVSASQLIFDGSYIVARKSNKAYKEISINNAKKTEEEIKDAVSQAYHTVLIAEENTRVLQQSKQSIETLLNEAKAMNKEGFIEDQNVDQFQLNLTNIRNSVNQSKLQYEIAKNLLKIQMGMDIKNTIEISETLPQLIEAKNGSTLLTQEFNFSTHFDYQIVKGNERMQRLFFRSEKYSFAPSVSAFFSHQQQNMSNNFDMFSGGTWYPSTVWGISVKLPLFTSGLRLAKMGKAKIEWEKAVTSSEQVSQNLMLNAQVAKASFSSAYDTYQSQIISLDLAKRIHNKNIKKYGEGMISSMGLTQSQNQLLNTEGMYIKSMLDLLNSKSELNKALGNN